MMNNDNAGIENIGGKSRNREIEILRLWCTIAVCMHHLRYCSEALPYGGGYLAVDFFFIVSGFYLCKGYAEKKSTNIGIIIYVKNRYIRLFKDYILAFLIALLINLLLFKVDIMSNLVGYIKEAFMVEFGSVESTLRMNPPDWYCGYFLISSSVVYMLQSIVKKHLRSFSLILGMVLYGVLAIVSGHLCVFPVKEGFLLLALVRALAGQLIGVFLARFCVEQRIPKIVKHKDGLIFMGTFVIISYMLFYDTAFRMTDYSCIFFFAILIYLCQFIKIKWIYRINETVWDILSQLIYVIFLNHYIIVKIFSFYNVINYLDWKVVSIIYIITVFVVSYFILQLRIILERFFERKKR